MTDNQEKKGFFKELKNDIQTISIIRKADPNYSSTKTLIIIFTITGLIQGVLLPEEYKEFSFAYIRIYSILAGIVISDSMYSISCTLLFMTSAKKRYFQERLTLISMNLSNLIVIIAFIIVISLGVLINFDDNRDIKLVNAKLAMLNMAYFNLLVPATLVLSYKRVKYVALSIFIFLAPIALRFISSIEIIKLAEHIPYYIVIMATVLACFAGSGLSYLAMRCTRKWNPDKSYRTAKTIKVTE